MFIILGILIVIIAGIIFFLSEDKFSRRTLSETQIEPIRAYLSECIQEVLVKEDLGKMRRFGGYLVGGEYIEGCGRVIAKVEVNNARNDLGWIIENRIENNLYTVCDLSAFEDQFKIIEGDAEAKVTFGKKRINIEVDTKLTISKGISNTNVGKIFVNIADDIYEVNELAKYIAERYSSGVSIDDLMVGSESVNNGVVLSVDSDTREELYSTEVLGEGCVERVDCHMDCPSGCCVINNKFAEDNLEVDAFRFALG